MEEQSSRRRVPGPAPLSRQREEYARLVARGVSNAQAGRRVEVFIAQDHAPAAEAEVDFGEVWVILDGVKTKCFIFVLWLAHSGKTVHRVYPTQSQEAFLQGHIEAFDAIGGRVGLGASSAAYGRWRMPLS